MRAGILTMVLAVLVVVAAGAAATESDEPGSQPTPTATPSSEAAPDGGAEGGEADEAPLANTLKWTTASEVDNFGFDIYRGVSEEGPFERITDEPLPGAGTTDEPQHYVFVDEAIDPTLDYYYYIESISLGGVRETFSPVIRAPAKRPADAAADGRE